jgi:hypothetical protein
MLFVYGFLTERFSQAVTLWTHSADVRFETSVGTLISELRFFMVFLSSHVNVSIIAILGHDRFFPDSFQFTNHAAIRRYIEQILTASR